MIVVCDLSDRLPPGQAGVSAASNASAETETPEQTHEQLGRNFACLRNA